MEEIYKRLALNLVRRIRSLELYIEHTEPIDHDNDESIYDNEKLWIPQGELKDVPKEDATKLLQLVKDMLDIHPELTLVEICMYLDISTDKLHSLIKSDKETNDSIN